VADCAEDARAIVDALEIDRPGIEGWWDDSVALLRPWGFSLDAIEAPVMAWHGRQDGIVPFHHGQWLARRLPTAHACLNDDDGHLTLFRNRVAAVHVWLLDQF
jgi:pimeloyl-ACP methyl ester carboxylesterase